MSECSIRWGAWFGDVNLPLPFPPRWHVSRFAPAGGDDVGDSAILQALRQPLGTTSLRDMARGRRAPCIVIDDLTRPTPGDRLIPPILAELAAAGVGPEQVTVLAGVANHRPLTRPDFIRKIGAAAAARCTLRNHFSWYDCVRIGTTTFGTPVVLNREFATSDLKILVGSVLPHIATGWGGGAKLVVPGVCGIETAAAWHGPQGPRSGYAENPSQARVDAEEAAQMANVDFIVNVVPNEFRGIAGITAGDLVESHRAAVQLACRLLRTPTPTGFDVCVLSAYPKDSEFLQYGNAVNLLKSTPEPVVHQDGTVVIATAASEGYGYHSLMGPNMLLPLGDGALQGLKPRQVIFFSPGVNEQDIPELDPGRGVFLANDWEAVVTRLHSRHGNSASVAVFPCAPMQLAEAKCDSLIDAALPAHEPDAAVGA